MSSGSLELGERVPGREMTVASCWAGRGAAPVTTGLRGPLSGPVQRTLAPCVHGAVLPEAPGSGSGSVPRGRYKQLRPGGQALPRPCPDIVLRSFGARGEGRGGSWDRPALSTPAVAGQEEGRVVAWWEHRRKGGFLTNSFAEEKGGAFEGSAYSGGWRAGPGSPDLAARGAALGLQLLSWP